MLFSKTYYHCKILLDVVQNADNIKLIFAQDTIGELFYVTKNCININNVNYKDGLEMINKISEMFYNSTLVNTTKTIAPKCNDEYDDMFIKCYVESNADYILTDDLKSGMKDISNINVLQSKDFIQKVSNGYFEKEYEVAVTMPSK